MNENVKKPRRNLPRKKKKKNKEKGAEERRRKKEEKKKEKKRVNVYDSELFRSVASAQFDSFDRMKELLKGERGRGRPANMYSQH